MKVTFGATHSLPEKYIPGRIYFIEDGGAIYVAVSETEIIQYSSYAELKNKQDIIEDIGTIRSEASAGASLAQSFSIISNEDIDVLFENN
jgi:hypothetical protein